MKRLLLLFVFAACATTQKTTVDVTEQVASDSWRVALRFAKPVEKIEFYRNRGGEFRAHNWKIVAPADAKWEGESIVLAKPAREVIVEFASDTRDRDKDYNVNLSFSDGSRLLYTGHLRTGDHPHRWNFRSTRGTKIVDDWDPDNDTYVYFGAIPPVETPRMTLIVDPGLPQWLVTQMNERVPPQFDYYAKRVGVDLDFKPLVMLSNAGLESRGFEFKGGTLPGIVQIAIKGEKWKNESAEGSKLWYKHVAHEIFHLWDGEKFPPGPGAEWLSEAGADWWALEAMRDAGIIDEEERKKAIRASAIECAAKWDGPTIPQSKNTRNYYTCGLVTQELAGNAAEIWKSLFTLGRPYTTEDFLKATEGNAAIRALVVDGVNEPIGPMLERELAKR